MKKFTINCDFGGQMSPFAVYIGTPKEGNHPLEHQAKWLSDNRGGTIPAEVMDAVSKLQELAKKNGVPLEELCVYALGTEEEQAALAAENGLGDGDDEENETDDGEQASDEAIAADNDGQIEDMTEEGGPVVDEELEQEERSSDGDEDAGIAAEDMAGEGSPVIDEELEQEDESSEHNEGTEEAIEDMTEEGGPVASEESKK